MLHQTLLGDAWENASVAVAVFDDDRNFIAFNSAFCRLVGSEREELLAGRVAPGLASAPSGTAELAHGDGSSVRVRFQAIETTVSGLPYLISLVWPEEEPGTSGA